MKILKSIGAVLAGMVFIVLTHSLTDFALETAGIFPKPDQGLHVTWMLVLATVYRSLFTIGGGYVTAMLAPSSPVLHSVVLGSIGLVISIFAVIVTLPMNLGPVWYPVALAVLALPCAVLGGKLRAR